MKVLLTICLLLGLVPSIANAQKRNESLRRPSLPTRVLNRVETKEAEQRLAEMGYWTGVVDGRFDSMSSSALIAFQKWEGRPITGQLTIDELEAIRISALPTPREVGYEHVEVDVDRQVLLLVNAVGQVKVLPTSTGTGKPFMEGGQESVAYTPRGRFVVYDKTFGWENGALGSVYYANYISGGVAIHGSNSVPTTPASHGCIRIPVFAAREVSRLLKVGTIVLVYDKISFVSAKEWVENPRLKEGAMLNAASIDYADYPEVGKTKSPATKNQRIKTIRAD